MNAPQRLALYGAGLVALFVAAFALAGAVVPEGSGTARQVTAVAGAELDHQEVDRQEVEGMETSLRGLAVEQDGLLLGPVRVPDEVGAEGKLSFSITSTDGTAVTGFETAHDKKLHLIVVRTDGAQFRHVHPEMSADGVWSIPWTWAAAGSYRVFTDFVPEASGAPVTLGRTVDVAGAFAPQPATEVSATDTTGGYVASLAGDLRASGASRLTVTVTKDGAPVTELEPYLGAYGHLVALRDGDLAYLHVHPTGDEPEPGSVSGPDITFMAQAPTPGRYLLYLDLKVGGVVRTAHFVLDASADGSGVPDHDH